MDKTITENTMLVTFSSKAAADVLMLSEHAKPILRIAGIMVEDPFPVRGVFSTERLPVAIARIEHAMAQEAPPPAHDDDDNESWSKPNPMSQHVGLKQRAYPLLELLVKANKAGVPVTWEAASPW
jgi:hypothetical protein